MSDTLTDRLRHFSRHTPSPYMRELASRAADSIAELEAALREARHERDGETRRADVAEEALRRIGDAEYINQLQGTANFERLQSMARSGK